MRTKLVFFSSDTDTNQLEPTQRDYSTWKSIYKQAGAFPSNSEDFLTLTACTGINLEYVEKL